MAAWTLPHRIADWCAFSDHLGWEKPQVLRYRDSRDASGHRTPDGFELAAGRSRRRRLAESLPLPANGWT